MRPGYDESPINPLPAVIWALALPMIASEALFALAQTGLIGGFRGAAFRLIGLQQAAFDPAILARMWQIGDWDARQLLRLVTYPFIHTGLTHGLFVIVFTLALGKMVAEQFRPWAVLVLFFGAAIGGALVYTLAFSLMPGARFEPLMGGYPAVYGFVGAFTYLLWVRLGVENANQMRAFSLIGFLLLFQLVFGLLFGGAGYSWIAEIAGFVVGFALSILLIPGGWARAMQRLRQR